jgi:hypothetical protein
LCRRTCRIRLCGDQTLELGPIRGSYGWHVAGQTSEQEQFRKLLGQNPVLQNCIVTGLRGLGKTVLLETVKPIAQSEGWLWAGNDMSERSSLTEESLLKRVIVDLSALLSPMFISRQQALPGFNRETEAKPLNLTISGKSTWRPPGIPKTN